MKKNLLVLSLLLIYGGGVVLSLLVSCKDPSQSKNVDTGWYEFERDKTQDLPEQRSVIIYVNDGKVERVGNQAYEYEKTALEEFKKMYAGLTKDDIKEDYFQPARQPNWRVLTVKDNGKITDGWYLYHTDDGKTKNYVYVNSKGAVTVAGTTQRLAAQNMKALYDQFYDKNTAIESKTADKFSITYAQQTIDFTLVATASLPEWCKKFEYL